jgi:hypothetical protein
LHVSLTPNLAAAIEVAGPLQPQARHRLAENDQRPRRAPAPAGCRRWNLFHTWGSGLAVNSLRTNSPTPTPRVYEIVP